MAKEERQLGEVTEQTEGSAACIPQKAKNVASERELYIPSVDLLTAQVEDSALCRARDRGREHRREGGRAIGGNQEIRDMPTLI